MSRRILISALGFLLFLPLVAAEANCDKAMKEIERASFPSSESFDSCLSEGDFNDHFQVFGGAARYLNQGDLVELFGSVPTAMWDDRLVASLASEGRHELLEAALAVQGRSLKDVDPTTQISFLIISLGAKNRSGYEYLLDKGFASDKTIGKALPSLVHVPPEYFLITTEKYPAAVDEISDLEFQVLFSMALLHGHPEIIESLLGTTRALETIDVGYKDQLLVLENRKLDQPALARVWQALSEAGLDPDSTICGLSEQERLEKIRLLRNSALPIFQSAQASCNPKG